MVLEVVRVLRKSTPDTLTPAGRSAGRYRRILLTSITGIGARVTVSAIGLLTVPFVLSYLGKERYGLWATITALTAWASLFDLGIANGLVNTLSRAHGRGDESGAQGHVSTALVALLIPTAVLGVGLGIAIPLVPWGDVLGARGIVDDQTIRESVTAVGGLFLLSLPLTITPQIYGAYQRTYIANAFTLLGASAGFCVLLVALFLRVRMPLLIVAFGCGSLLGTASAFVFGVTRVLPWIRPRLGAVSMTAFKELASRSVPIFLFQVGSLCVNQTQTIMLARRSGLEIVADYAVANRVYLLAMSLIQLGTNSFIPAFREAVDRGDHGWTRRAFRRLLVLRVTAALLGGVVFVCFGSQFVRMWLRGNAVQFSAPVWFAMALLLLVSTWSTTYSELLSIMDRLWVLVAVVLLNGASVIGLTFYLAPRWGVLGTLVALLVPTIVVTIVLGNMASSLLRRLDNSAGARATNMSED